MRELTDVHIADGEFPPTPYPIVPGHEFAGRVVALGEGVPGEWRGGERVAVDPSLFCGHCPACHAGRGNLCANWRSGLSSRSKFPLERSSGGTPVNGSGKSVPPTSRTLRPTWQRWSAIGPCASIHPAG